MFSMPRRTTAYMPRAIWYRYIELVKIKVPQKPGYFSKSGNMLVIKSYFK